jgi:hypothetical protein
MRKRCPSITTIPGPEDLPASALIAVIYWYIKKAAIYVQTADILSAGDRDGADEVVEEWMLLKTVIHSRSNRYLN